MPLRRAPPGATRAARLCGHVTMGAAHQTTAPQGTTLGLGRMGGRLCGTPGSAQAVLLPPLPLLLRLLGVLSSGAAAACCRRRRSLPAAHWLDPPLRLLPLVRPLHLCCRCCCLLARQQLAGVPATLQVPTAAPPGAGLLPTCAALPGSRRPAARSKAGLFVSQRKSSHWPSEHRQGSQAGQGVAHLAGGQGRIRRHPQPGRVTRQVRLPRSSQLLGASCKLFCRQEHAAESIAQAMPGERHCLRSGGGRPAAGPVCAAAALVVICDQAAVRSATATVPCRAAGRVRASGTTQELPLGCLQCGPRPNCAVGRMEQADHAKANHAGELRPRWRR